MFNFFDKYFNTWRARVILKDCLAERYSIIEHRAINCVQQSIKDFLFQCGDETILMDVYDNPGLFNPLFIGQKPVARKNYTIAELIPLTSVKGDLAIFLFLLAHRLRPAIILELGTHLGISGMYLAAGISRNLHGIFYTVDRSVNSFRYAEINLNPWKNRVKMIKGEFKDVFPNVIFERKNIDLAFIDGDHQKGAIIEYLNLLFPAMAAGGVVVFDDINWSSYAAEDWKTISGDKRVFFSKNCGRFGFIVVK